jgi:alpha-L-fucosidase 2
VTSSTSYNRSVDFSNGLHTTIYTANDGNTYTSTVYCSYPDQVCVYTIISSSSLPQITTKLENQLTDPTLIQVNCTDSYVSLEGVTQAGPPLGMRYFGLARVEGNTGSTTCDGTSLVVPAGLNTFSLVISADTNYDQKAGTAANHFSFQGPDPTPKVQLIASKAALKQESDIRQAHIADYQSLASQFTLELPDTAGSQGLETSVLLDRYNSAGDGDPYLESTLFELGRHLFISAGRDNSLPPNLAGRWSETLEAAWSADYHSNINFQMNHWGADQTGLGDLQVAAFNYMQDTWVPRGSETAQLLYNAQGWVAHDEINIFGHTGMKGATLGNDAAQWANYPASAAWMMQHVFDHFSYSQDTNWLEMQGYPLMKGVAQFWLSQLQVDEYFEDGTLIVNPCNSPEHGPTTFACTHFQQLIYQLFTNLLSAQSYLSTPDTAFAAQVSSALATLDTGVHIGDWGEIKEWKIPDSLGYDFQNDTHRHLSHLVGWYPGYSISSFLGGYTNSTIQAAVTTSLISRGIGNGPDANAGWEKVWRAACWARLNNTSEAYFELKYAIEQNFANNGLSMYSGKSTPFQIDANFGLVGAVTSFLVVDLPGMASVVLGPAIPSSWGGGSVQGLRLRGGGSVDFSWDGEGVVDEATVRGRSEIVRIVNKEGTVLVST